MNVSEIILEISPEEIAKKKAIRQRNIAAQSTAAKSQAAIDKARADSIARRTVTQPALQAKAASPIKTTAANISQKVSGASQSVKTGISREEVAKKLRNFLSKNPASREKVRNRTVKKVSSKGLLFLKFIKWAGYLEIVYQYFDNVGLFDEMLEHYNATGDTVEGMTPVEWKLAVKYEREVLIAQLVASKFLAQIAVKGTLAITGINYLIRIVGGASAVASFGSSLAVIAASEVATIALQRWMQSDQGKKVIADVIANYIDPVANFTGISQLLMPEIKKIASKADSAAPSAVTPTQTSVSPAGAVAKPSTSIPASSQSTSNADYVSSILK